MILDTNALSAFVDGAPELGAILRAQPRAAIPIVVLGEFRYGIAGSRHRKTYEDWLDVHLRDFDLLAITPDILFHTLLCEQRSNGWVVRSPRTTLGSRRLRCSMGYRYSVETSTLTCYQV